MSAVVALAVAASLLVPVEAHAADTAVQPGRYENTTSAIAYTGAWSTATSSSDSEGSYANLNVDGSASVTFTGTGATWYTRTNTYSGIADVSVDGVKKASVDLYSATGRTKQNVWSVSGLTDGTHTLKIARTGTKNDSSTGLNVTLDYVDVVTTTPAPTATPSPTATPTATPTAAPAPKVVGQGTYENDDPAVTLNGTWTKVASNQDSGGSTGSLGTAGYAELSFSTSGIRWITRLNSYSGIADVYLDGVKKTSVDLYASTTKTQQVGYQVTGLPETPHTIRIVRTGTKNPSSSSPNVMLDAFVAPDVHAPVAPAGLTTTIAGDDVALTWAANPERDVKAYRVYRRDGAGTTRTLVGTTSGTVQTLTDTARFPGLAYTYDLTAVDTSDLVSPFSAAAPVTMPITPQPAGTYENDSPARTLVGPWSTVSSNMDSGGSYATLNGAGYAQVAFNTSGIRWIARANTYSGIADVYLDGVKKATVDLYSATTKYQQVAYEVKGLPETPHSLRIVRTATKNASSTSTAIMLDGFVAPDIYAPAVPSALKATAIRTGAKLTWTKSPDADVAAYRVFRRAAGSTTDVLVGTTTPDVTSFSNVGLADGGSYSWSVVARDTSANDSAPSLAAAFTNGADPYASFPQRYATCPTATVTVSTRAQLLSALAAATPGTVVRLAPGSYGANIDVATQATPDKPVWICGPRTAVVDNADITKGYGFRVTGATNVVIAGMTVRNVQKGVAVLGGKGVTVADLRVENIGDEAVHLKNQTTDSTVIGNSIALTGLSSPNYGEGVYIGTAEGNWCLYNGCAPDTSDRNLVAFNDIRSTTAEPMEAKAGTSDGTMWKNTLDGAAITSSDTDSLVQVMGNGWVVAGNTGTHTPADAIQVWNTTAGYGLGNIVYGNGVADALPGYGVRMPYADGGNVVGCSNAAPAAALGMTNKTCQL